MDQKLEKTFYSLRMYIFRQRVFSMSYINPSYYIALLFDHNEDLITSLARLVSLKRILVLEVRNRGATDRCEGN